ncbi:hypothetical protein E0493_17990 [Roseomonas sp. M0104]|uniref:Uncharacterized protein n=1 Tax=Teichococcus coralli TaxID=2545983 RepID=A0A845BGM7_9PROT|nr:hypothetical protein [Pseudoroseomonas coralli]MXP65240.1 hypothetical protein [Pseudoroseomonas coralli]
MAQRPPLLPPPGPRCVPTAGASGHLRRVVEGMAGGGSPQEPLDPVFMLAGLRLRVVCGCGHSTKPQIGKLAVRHRVPSVTPIRQVIERLRCSRCGGRPTVAEPLRASAA